MPWQSPSSWQKVSDICPRRNFSYRRYPGGLLGKYCTHAYAHATKEGASALPSVLKGSDMIAYEVFRALGVEILVRTILQNIREHYYDSDEIEGDLLTHTHVGNGLWEPINTNMEWREWYDMTEIYESFGSLKKVTWLNAPTAETKSMQLSFLRVGCSSQGT